MRGGNKSSSPLFQQAIIEASIVAAHSRAYKRLAAVVGAKYR
jgi:hypothetical protein